MVVIYIYDVLLLYVFNFKLFSFSEHFFGSKYLFKLLVFFHPFKSQPFVTSFRMNKHSTFTFRIPTSSATTRHVILVSALYKHPSLSLAVNPEVHQK